MSKIDALIQELCPEGVEYKAVKELCEHISSGRCKSKKAEGKYEVYGSTGIIGYTDSYAYEGEKILVGRVGSAGFTYLARGKYDVSDNTLIITPRSEHLLKYIYYQLVNIDLRRLARGSAQPLVTAGDVGRVLIPVPPLSIQSEIVRILDAFTELTAELTAELTVRKRQYEYYRDKLLSFEPEVAPEVTLGDLGKWSGGKTPAMDNLSFWQGGTIPWISSKDMKNSILADTQDHITEEALKGASMTLYPADSVAIVTRSGILKRYLPVAFVPFETTVNQDVKVLRVNENVLPKYAFHLMLSKAPEILSKAKKQGGTVESIDFDKLLQTRVPLPPLSTQERLVRVLDNFDAICQDLEIGLPAEITARKKQYEYYRDQLLNFAQFGAIKSVSQSVSQSETR